MDSNQVLNGVKADLATATGRFADELKKMRTGRASAGMLDGLMVEAYGTKMPLIQVGSIATPEPQLLQITPFDPANLQAIAQAVREDQSLGLNPIDDGRVVRIQMPPMTEERRQQVVKQLHEKTETCMIALRQARQEAIQKGDQAKKAKQIGEDEHARFEKQVEELVNSSRAEAEKLSKAKEQEILTI